MLFARSNGLQAVYNPSREQVRSGYLTITLIEIGIRKTSNNVSLLLCLVGFIATGMHVF